MIKVHFHHYRGRKCAHVYSDKGFEELVAWMEEQGIPRAWLQSERRLPHVDLWGEKMDKHTADLDVVSARQFGQEMSRYRRRIYGAGESQAGG